MGFRHMFVADLVLASTAVFEKQLTIFLEQLAFFKHLEVVHAVLRVLDVLVAAGGPD